MNDICVERWERLAYGLRNSVVFGKVDIVYIYLCSEDAKQAPVEYKAEETWTSARNFSGTPLPKRVEL
jgi:hypothetical protein